MRDAQIRWVFAATSMLLLLSNAPLILADTPKFPTVLYGASYYHEYMPYERLEKDVALMEKAGISFARVGESTWGVLEPRDGEFDFSWLERVIDRLHKAGIKVMLGTPTYSIPAWLFKKHPEIQVKQINQPRYKYGLRQMTDLTHPTYRFYAERIIRRLIGHFKDHPAVIGFQLDNETHASGTADVHVQSLFREHVKRKFKTAGELNKAWGLNYWGQNIADFDELPPRDGMLNPGYKLEWERFQQNIIAGFLAWQAAIVKEIKRPDQFISHDFVGGFPSDVDQYETAKALDIPAVSKDSPPGDNLKPTWAISVYQAVEIGRSVPVFDNEPLRPFPSRGQKGFDVGSFEFPDEPAVRVPEKRDGRHVHPRVRVHEIATAASVPLATPRGLRSGASG